MGLFQKLRDSVQNKVAADPIDCPRGWGQVQFHLTGGAFWPFFWLERKCPIGGVESCSTCHHAPNPDAFKLEENLQKLAAMRDAGTLTAEDHEQRREALISLFGTGRKSSQEGFRVTAWILAPIGTLLTAAGALCAIYYDPRCWAMAIVGAVLLALSVSFAVLAGKRPEPPANEQET